MRSHRFAMEGEAALSVTSSDRAKGSVFPAFNNIGIGLAFEVSSIYNDAPTW